MFARGAPRGVPFPAYHYELPRELIAQDPPARRADARLLLVARGRGVLGEARCRDLPRLLRAGDMLVVNDSRVLPARLLARLPTGGRVELLLVREVAAAGWLALARPARRLQPGLELRLEAAAGSPAAGGQSPGRAATPAPSVTVIAVEGDGYVSLACDAGSLAEVAERWGDVPLPPYIARDPRAVGDVGRRQRDRERYQTVYARTSGSVAAPTAGLHFDAELLAALRQAGIGLATVTLHVGPGTFRPPTAQDYARKRLHPEVFIYPARTDGAIAEARAAGRRVIAVGTTVLRVLETVRSLALPGPPVGHAGSGRTSASAGGFAGRGDAPEGVEFVFGGAGERGDPVFMGAARWEGAGWRVDGATRLFMRPPDEIAAADGLLTNLHLPGSSLLMLVAAFGGEQCWRGVYEHAVTSRMRFYSYGDAMLILPSAAGGGSSPTGEGELAFRGGVPT